MRKTASLIKIVLVLMVAPMNAIASDDMTAKKAAHGEPTGRSVLQAYPAASYEVSAILFRALTTKRALVLAPNGEKYVLTLNSRLGNADGRVVDLTPEGITIEENDPVTDRRRAVFLPNKSYEYQVTFLDRE